MKAFTKTLPAYVLAAVIGGVSMAAMAMEGSIGELSIKDESIEEANPENGQEMSGGNFSPIEPEETLDFQIQGEEDLSYSSESLVGPLPPSFKITFRNQCHKPVYIALHILDYSSFVGTYWATKGWWDLYAGEDLRSQNTYLTHSYSRYWYFYAESTDGRHVWSGNDAFFPVRGSQKNYGFRKMYYGGNAGDWAVVNLTCNG